MSIEHNYEVNLTWKNDRKGVMNAPDLISQIEVATPPEFPKGITGIWSPEHLLVAAVNSCMMTTFLAIAEKSNAEFLKFYSKAIGKLEMIEGKYMISEIILIPKVIIANEFLREKMEGVLKKAGTACLISNSIKSAIIFIPEVCLDLVHQN